MRYLFELGRASNRAHRRLWVQGQPGELARARLLLFRTTRRVMADAFRRSSATRITAVIPYFGYARQDRRPRSARVAISAKVVADMLTVVGVNRVLTVDLHADQIQGFFDIPVDNIYGSPVLVDDIEDQRFENLMIVSPDIGGVVRARRGQVPGRGPCDHRQASSQGQPVRSDAHHR